MKKLLALCIFASFIILTSTVAQAVEYDRLAPHPRLMLHSGDITAMRALRTTSAAGRAAHEKILSAAERSIDQAVATDRAEIEPMEVLERIFFLSYSYLTSDDMRYARRAEQEMLAISAMPEWGADTKDVATLTMALSIGYDWLYRALPVHSRSIIGTAIYEKALLPLEGVAMNDTMGNVGMLFGAVATADRAPEFCKTMINKYIEAGEQILSSRSGDIARIDEWSSDVALLAMMYETLSVALEGNGPAPSLEALQREADKLNYLVAPSRLYYNYGGMQAEAKCIPAKYWVAERCGNSSLVATDEMLAAEGSFVEDYTLPLYMILAAGNDYSRSKLPNAKSWHDDDVVVYRSGWDRSSTYLAVKGGDAASAGTYVLETGGVRWTTLTGGVDGRLVIDGVSSDGNGEAHVREVFDASRHHGATVDLSALYSAQARGVVRTVELGKGDKLTVTDQVTCGSQPATIEWSITTAAQAEVQSANTICLKQDGQTMYLKVRSRGQIEAKIWPDANGARRVGFVLTAGANSNQNIEVTFSSQAGGKGLQISLPRLNFRRK